MPKRPFWIFLPASVLAILTAFSTGLGTPALSSFPDENPANWGIRKPISFEAVRRDFADPGKIYAPFIFWFWDEPLDPAKMASMARTLAGQGFNPGYAHARRSMVGTPDLPAEQWLADPWFSAFGAALAEAEAAGNYLGYCDEYWWPSLQAAGRVLQAHPELEAVSLKWTALDVKSGKKIKVPASFFSVAAALDRPLTAADTAPLSQKPPVYGKWIWHPDGRQERHLCRFRKEFEVPRNDPVVKAELKVAVDNAYILFLDGRRVGEGSAWNEPQTFDLTAALTPGRHVLAVEARNEDGPYGLIAGLQITLKSGRTPSFLSDPTWRTSLSETSGWETPDFEDSGWAAAAVLGGAADPPWYLDVDPRGSHRPRTIQSASLRVIGAGVPFSWRAPAGSDWRVYIFDKYPHAGVDGGKVNCLDERLAPAFIEAALEPYARRLPERLGISIPGDFIDHEGAFGWRLAWSETLDRRYKDRYGRDIRLWMPLLLDADMEGLFAKARWEWFDLVSDLYAVQFQAVTDWHERRGMYTTVHVWEESLLPQATAVGDHMKILRAVTMPGQDCLETKAVTPHDFKEVQSVAEFEGRRAATELLGAGGWKVFTPSFLKQSANAVTAWGMSHVIPHGVFATRKLSGNPWMPDWYSENPMFPWLHLWTDFVRRTSFVNSQGQAVPDVLLYNPIESIWMLCDARHFDATRPGPNIEWSWPEDGGDGERRGNAIDRSYSKAIADLTEARVEFLVGDRHYLGQMEIRSGRLVRGAFEFKAIVLPPLEILPLGVAKKIVDFARAGGRVYALGVLPAASAENGARDAAMISLMATLRMLPTFTACPPEPQDVQAKWQYDPGWVVEGEAGAYGLKPMIAAGALGLESPVRFLSGEFPMLQQRRRIDGREFFWVANNTGRAQRCEVEISEVHGTAFKWDGETGAVIPLGAEESEAGTRLALSFEAYEGFWLVIDPATPAEPPQPAAAEPEWRDVLAVEGPWRVTFDPSAQPEMEFPMAPPAEFVEGVDKPLEDWKAWGLDKFSGLLDYAASFEAPTRRAPSPSRSFDGQAAVEEHYILDLGTVSHAAEVWVNGISCGARIWGPHVYDVTAALRPGRNELRVRIANLIDNSYGDPRPSGLFGPVILRRGIVL